MLGLVLSNDKQIKKIKKLRTYSACLQLDRGRKGGKGRRTGSKEGRKPSLKVYCLSGSGLERSGGQREAREKDGQWGWGGRGTLPEEAEPLESCYCLRSLLREALSKKSLLERARLETSCSQRASEPCEMT